MSHYNFVTLLTSPFISESCSSQPVPSSRPSVEHDTLLQVLQSSYSCSPPKPLAGHLQQCQTEERFITRPMACTDSAACVCLLSPPAVGWEELCTGHWVHSRSCEDPGDRLAWFDGGLCSLYKACVTLCTH